jgi:hypothetical protein
MHAVGSDDHWTVPVARGERDHLEPRADSDDPPTWRRTDATGEEAPGWKARSDSEVILFFRASLSVN